MSRESLLNGVKSWLFPSLVTILAMMIWHDVTEMRSDIKSLLAQSNIDKTKIDQLERDMRSVEQAVFNKKIIAMAEVKFPYTYHITLFKHENIYNLDDIIENENL